MERGFQSVQAVGDMTRAQLRGVIGYASYAIPRLVKLCEKYLDAEGDEGACSSELAYAARRLEMYRLRLEDARAEWDRRGYVVSTGPRRKSFLRRMHEDLGID